MRSRALRNSIIATAIIAGLVGFSADRLSERWLAVRLRKQALSTTGVEASLLAVRRLAMLEHRGAVELVELLEVPAERRWVGAEARHQLDQAVRRWRKLPPIESARRAEQLAAALRKHSADWEQETTIFVGEIARQLLTWPIPPGHSSGDLVADCEYLLHRSMAAQKDSAIAKTNSGTTDDGGESATDNVGGDRWNAAADRSHADSSLPSRRPLAVIAVKSDPIETAPEVERQEGTPLDPSIEPKTAALASPQYAPPRRSDASDVEIPVPEDDRNTVPRGDTQVVVDPFESIHGETRDPFRIQADREVILRLASYRVEEVLGAAKELRRRGYSDAELNVAEDAVDPDVMVRRGLVERLPYLTGVDRKRWLLWLAEDVDLDVRRQAVMMLATMLNSDPRIATQLRRIQVNERDPWIQKRLQTVLR